MLFHLPYSYIYMYFSNDNLISAAGGHDASVVQPG